MNKKFISFVNGYHPQLFTLLPDENYHMSSMNVMGELGYSLEMILYKTKLDVSKDPSYNQKIKLIYENNLLRVIWYIFKNRKNSILYVNTILLSSLVLGIFHKKVIFMPHTQSLPRTFFKRIVALFFYKFFSMVRVVSPREVILLKKYGINAKFIPLSVSKKFLNTNKKKGNNILLLGNITSIKDPITIIKSLQLVIQKYPDIKVYQIGKYEEFLFQGKNYISLLKEYGIYKNFHLYGSLNQDEIIALNLDSTIYINSSIQEGQCLSVYDSILLGHAICLPHIPSFESVFGNNVLFHNVGDYRKLANNISYYIENHKIKERNIIANQKLIIEKYNYDIIKQKIQNEFVNI